MNTKLREKLNELVEEDIVTYTFYSLKHQEWVSIQGVLEFNGGSFILYEPNDSVYYSFQGKLFFVFNHKHGVKEIKVYRPNCI